MDYEKKYKEVVAFIRECTPDENGFITIYPQEIFPELTESEDEKIRNTLKQYFEDYKTQEKLGVSSFFGVPTDKILAWLEKQGEQKPVIDSPCNDCINRKGCINCENGELRETEQKPVEWSEDDKAFLDDVICKVKSDLILNKDEKNWLKSLKDRCLPQPKQEWSEEDNDILLNIIEELEAVRDNIGEVCYPAYNRLINWLKALHPQKHWKPTEEQINCLELKIYGYMIGELGNEKLKDLLEQLKAL